MRRRVKSQNERNPCLLLLPPRGGHSAGTAGKESEEGGDDVKPAWPLCPGLHKCNNGQDRGTQSRKAEQIPQTWPQFGSGSATRPREAGVASNRRSATLRGIRSRVLYTPPVTPWKSLAQEIPKRDECVSGDWGEVVTRYPYRKVGVDHLLSFSLLFYRKALLTL